MPISKQSVTQGVVAGTLASLLSAGVLLIAGRRETGSASAPVNAVSHWFWGGDSLWRNDTDVAHTAVGYLTHHVASTFWATLYAVATRNVPETRTLPGIAVGAVATSAVACFVDYEVVPKRLTPGFEHRISVPSMVATYAAFACGLALGALAMRDSRM